MSIFNASSVMGKSNYALFNLRLKSQMNQSLLTNFSKSRSNNLSWGLSPSFLNQVYDAKAVSPQVMRNYYERLKEFDQSQKNLEAKENPKNEPFLTFIDQMLLEKSKETGANKDIFLGSEVDKSV